MYCICDHSLILFRYSILPAFSLDGILHLDVLDGSYKAATFNEFIDSLLNHMNPFPQKNSVIVMDNASIHKSFCLEEMVQQRYLLI
jgi:DDE superfamily endonuclease